MKPNFKHDCCYCIFLGNTGENKANDAYLSTHTPTTSLIVRWGNKGQEYASFPLKYIVEISPSLTTKEDLTDLDIAYLDFKLQIEQILLKEGK